MRAVIAGGRAGAAKGPALADRETVVARALEAGTADAGPVGYAAPGRDRGRAAAAAVPVAARVGKPAARPPRIAAGWVAGGVGATILGVVEGA